MIPVVNYMQTYLPSEEMDLNVAGCLICTVYNTNSLALRDKEFAKIHDMIYTDIVIFIGKLQDKLPWKQVH